MVDGEYNAKKFPIIHLYEEWELSPNIIKTLIGCGITNKTILRQMHKHDLGEIFPKRNQIGDKIFFRCKLQTWREEIKAPPLQCCDTNKIKTIGKVDSDFDMDDFTLSPMSSRSSSPEQSPSLPKAIAMPLLTPISSNNYQQKQETETVQSPPAKTPRIEPQPSSSANLVDLKPRPIAARTSTLKLRQIAPVPNLDFSTISQNFNDSFSLETELRKSFQGQKILENYRRYKILGKADQNNLTRVVANYHLMTKMPLSAQVYTFYATKIQELFPSENKETYYLPANYKQRRAPRGKLYDRFCNMKRQSKADEQLLVRNISTYGSYQVQNPNFDDSLQQACEQFQLQYAEDDYITMKNWLMENDEPWQEVVSEWSKSSPYRLNEIRKTGDVSKSAENWPRYRDPQGFELIDIDFAQMYPDKSVEMLLNFDSFVESVQPIFSTEVKDKWSVKQLEILESFDTNKDTKDCIAALLLHAVMHPPVLPGRIKLSITEAQRDLVLMIDDIMNLDNERDKWDPAEPKVVAVGTTIEDLHEFYVDFDGILYQLPTFVKCLDTVIKLCFIFNINYPIRSKYVWTFFQQYFFKIDSDDCHPKIINLINRINK
ncbi:hypothetical protein DMENIID0001_104890 [Sergentomyia squamirostris]